MSAHTTTPQQPSQFRRGMQAIGERGARARERLRPQSLHAPSLDWLNFLVADVRGSLGPYVAVFLVAHQGWTPTAVGIVTTIGGWLGLAGQTPIGAWLDRTNRKRGVLLWALLVLSAGAVTVAWIPGFWPVLLANGAMQLVSGVFDPAIAALTVGLCVRRALTARMGRNAAWARAGNVVVACVSGALAMFVSPRSVFLQVPVIAALTAIVAITIPHQKVDLRRARGLVSKDCNEDGPHTRWSLLRHPALLVFALGSFLYELADAPLLTIVGQELGVNNPSTGLVLTSALIIAAQIGMLGAAIFVGKRADGIGYRWLLVVSFAMLPMQAALTILSVNSWYLLFVQIVGGVGTGLFAALTPIWLADMTRGTGHYNLSQGVMGTMRALGVSSSALVSEVLVEHWGYMTAFAGCGVVGALAAALLWFGLPPREDERIAAAAA